MSKMLPDQASRDLMENVAEEARKKLFGELFPHSGETRDTFSSLLTGANTVAQTARAASVENLANLLPVQPDKEFNLSDWVDLDSSAIDFSDNVIGNNAAILLTDNAQSTVNFLYINPIEFFNAGRPGDITLNIDLSGETPQAMANSSEASGRTAPTESTGSVDRTSSGGNYSDNIVSNNAAILLTDDAQSDVDFLYVNPIEFFNEGRGSDITLNVTGGDRDETQLPDSATSEATAPGQDDTGTERTSSGEETETTSELTGLPSEEALNDVSATEISNNVIDNNAAVLMTDDAQSTVNFLYINPIEFFNGGRGSDITLNIDLGDQVQTGAMHQADTETNNLPPHFENDVSDLFEFDEITSDQTATTEADSTEGMINDNVVGNNAAILLTDNAQSTVNFIYVNPIEFFNEGRSGDITLNISVGQNDDLVLL